MAAGASRDAAADIGDVADFFGLSGDGGDSIAEMARARAAPRGPLDELLEELLEDAGGWLTHLVAVDVGAGLVCLAAPELPRCVVVPGSFNPMHAGHEQLAQRGAEAAQKPPGLTLFELCAVNADKGALPTAELSRRVTAIVARGHRALVTRASLFSQKAELCHGCDFAVGYDTYRRIVDARYYAPPGVSHETADAATRQAWVFGALGGLAGNHVRFMVAGRKDGDAYKELETDLLLPDLPPDLEKLFVPVPHFRVDISSTELRGGTS